MIPSDYTRILYSLRYRELQKNGMLDVFYKDTPDCYKVALLISNTGQSRIVSAANLEKVKQDVNRLPEFMYDKPINYLTILLHANNKDQFLKSNNIISIGANGKDYTHRCEKLFSEEMQAFSFQRETEHITKKQLTSRRLDSKATFAYVNMIFILACIYVYITQYATDKMAISAYSLLDKNFYTLFTYMFAHTGFFHLCGNCITMAVLGRLLEKRIGHLKYFLFVILSGMYAGLLACMFRAWTGNTQSTVGMSGVIYGICAALVIYQYKECKSRYSAIIMYMIISFGYGLLNPHTDNLVHFTGIIVGLVGMSLIYIIHDIKKNRIDGKYYATMKKYNE